MSELNQLKDYCDFLVEVQDEFDVSRLTSEATPRSILLSPQRPTRRRGWLVGVAAAVFVLVFIGGVAWLTNSGDAPVAVVPTTIEESSPTTVSSTETTVSSTETTVAAEPVLPPGEGPQLGFVPVELPSGEWLDSGVWFQGALYAISDGDLFRSSDGFTWELLPGPPDIANLQGSEGLETGGGLLVYAGVDEVDYNSGCSLPGDAIVVHTSNNGVDWKTSRIDLPIPDSPTVGGCYGAFVGLRDGMAAGPQGIMITALIQGEIHYGDIFEAEFGLGLDRETLEIDIDIDGGVMEVITADGEVYEIDLQAAGYLDDIESFGPEPVGTGYAWFSPEGQTWSQLDASGPLDRGAIAAVVATPDGFVATSTGSGTPGRAGSAQMLLWETTDGTTWIEKSNLSDSHLSDSPSVPTDPRTGLRLWNGRLVAATAAGVWTIEDTPQELIASEGTSGLSVLEIGEFGLVGIHAEWDKGGNQVLFSANGTTWNRWTPPEFGPEDWTVYVVGIGDDFVVLRLWQWDEETETADLSLWVGSLP